MASAIFNLPIVYLTVIYARLLYFIRRQTPQLARTQQGRRAQRDLTVARRILFLVNALTLPVLPNLVYVSIANLHPIEDGWYYMYRVQWMGPSISILLASVWGRQRPTTKYHRSCSRHSLLADTVFILLPSECFTRPNEIIIYTHESIVFTEVLSSFIRSP